VPVVVADRFVRVSPRVKELVDLVLLRWGRGVGLAFPLVAAPGGVKDVAGAPGRELFAAVEAFGHRSVDSTRV
jgi:hypothetical protein